MLGSLLTTTIRITRFVDGQSSYMEGYVLDGDDEKLIRLYEGQLKEIPGSVEPGQTYQATFTPYINNRWPELRLIAMELALP